MIFVEEDDNRFYIKESTLPNAGLGCFAKILIPKGDWLEIIGVYVKTGGIADKCTHYAKRYKFAGSPKMDAKIVPMGFGGMVNHSSDSKVQNVVLEYCAGLSKRSSHSGQVIYRALRDIQPDEELIGNYGDVIGAEVDRMAKNTSFFLTELEDWQKFVSLNPYNLQDLIDKL
jgi:hypothetical protein